MENLKVGIVGLGGIATRMHIPALATIPNVTIQAGAEINQQQAERTQRRFGIPHIYSSYEEMFSQETLDAVYICLCDGGKRAQLGAYQLNEEGYSAYVLKRD